MNRTSTSKRALSGSRVELDDYHLKACSSFPVDAVARIYRPGRPVTTSARKQQPWILTFEPRYPTFIDPLVGYTGTSETLDQVRLQFPSLEAAVAYAQRQHLTYGIEGRGGDLLARDAVTLSSSTADVRQLQSGSCRHLPNALQRQRSPTTMRRLGQTAA